MARVIGDQNKWMAYACKRDTVASKAIVDIGATGAPTVNSGSDPDWTVTRASAGVYNITFPPTPAQNICGSELCAWISLSSAVTVTTATVTAVNYTAGTATIRTTLGGATAADPASGDQFCIELTAGLSGTF